MFVIADHGHNGRITGAYWMPLNKAIMTTGGDGTIKLFDPQVRRCYRLDLSRTRVDMAAFLSLL